MVITNGIVASLVRNPMMIKIEQINSANTTKRNEISEPMPIGSPNFRFPLSSLRNFGHPCVSIIPDVNTLTINSPILIGFE